MLEVLASDRLALGPWLERFERAAEIRLGQPHAVAVSSGTAALHLLVRAAGLGPGDEVVTSPFSFVASANAITFEGATPVFADIDEETLNLAPREVARKVGTRTRGILAVHIFGLPAPMEEIAAIARQESLVLIEDACEAIGARVGGRPVGSWGIGATFAFYPNKQITTGEGGMVLTNDADVARLVRSLSNQGRDAGEGWFDHVRIGFNYRMCELQAALGAVQLARLDDILAARRRVASIYAGTLARVPGVRTLETPDGYERSWFVYPVRLDDEIDRDRVATRLSELGVQNGRYFPPIHLLPPYRERYGTAPGDFPVTERVARTTLALPFHNHLDQRSIDEICRRLRRAIDLSR